MVHISDGVLSPEVVVAGWILSAGIIAFSFWWSSRYTELADEMPRLSLMTAAFFVASLIHIPVGPSSVHLILNGVVGIVLGVLSFPSIFIGLVLQAFLFQHGGISTIGINTVNMGIPALVAYGISKIVKGRLHNAEKESLIAVISGLSGGIAVALAALLTSVSLIMTDLIKGSPIYHDAAIILLAAHAPLVVIEAIITGSVVVFLLQVKPELLAIARATA